MQDSKYVTRDWEKSDTGKVGATKKVMSLTQTSSQINFQLPYFTGSHNTTVTNNKNATKRLSPVRLI